MEAHRNERILVIYLFSGHGLEQLSDINMIVNEYDSAKKFYKMSKAEYKVKYQARIHPNSWHLAFFACCRELYNPEKHSDGLPGPTAEACLAARALLIEQKAIEEAKHISQLEAANAKIADLEGQISKLHKQFEGKADNSDEDETNDKPPVKNNEESKDGRGEADVRSNIKENYCIVTASQPGTGIAAETTLIDDLSRGLEGSFDRRTLITKFPDAFVHTQLQDAQL